MGKVSIIVPTFKEAENIPELTRQIDVALKKTKYKYEIIIVDDNSQDGIDQKVKELEKTPEASSIETLYLTDGRVFELYSQPQRQDENIIGRVWSFRDITDRKKAEQELRIAKEKAEAASKA